MERGDIEGSPLPLFMGPLDIRMDSNQSRQYGTGHLQDPTVRQPFPDGATGYHLVRVTVTQSASALNELPADLSVLRKLSFVLLERAALRTYHNP